MRTIGQKHRGRAVSRGDWLIAILLVGVLVAVGIPSLRLLLRSGTYQIELERQRRTMTDIRNLATAIESYRVDIGLYPDASCASGLYTVPTTTGNLDSASWTRLTPTYIAAPPFRDGWGWAMCYDVDVPHNHYEIASLGKDGVPEGSFLCGTTTSFNNDIIFVDGTFIQWPEGEQR